MTGQFLPIAPMFHPEEPSVVQAMANADNNAEGVDVYNGKRVRISRSFAWLTWEFGIGISHDPYDEDEPVGGWLCLGPLTLSFEIKRRAA